MSKQKITSSKVKNLKNEMIEERSKIEFKFDENDIDQPKGI
jgi:hypothetical protein